MSKIGRKPIAVGSVKIDIKGNAVHYTGKKASGVHELPEFIKPTLADGFLTLKCEDCTREQNRFWGMHRALLANEIHGASVGFDKVLEIEGLGFKAQSAGNALTLSLGYSHKVELTVPKDVTLSIDKLGKILTFSSHDKALVGEFCDRIRSYRMPEPYKGTGIRYAGEKIVRKAGKTKAA
ncbi:MAG: 50S ribosomal protein L6 [Candidatus Babeliales bacterium]